MMRGSIATPYIAVDTGLPWVIPYSHLGVKLLLYRFGRFDGFSTSYRQASFLYAFEGIPPFEAVKGLLFAASDSFCLLISAHEVLNVVFNAILLADYNNGTIRLSWLRSRITQYMLLQPTILFCYLPIPTIQTQAHLSRVTSWHA